MYLIKGLVHPKSKKKKIYFLLTSAVLERYIYTTTALKNSLRYLYNSFTTISTPQ